MPNSLAAARLLPPAPDADVDAFLAAHGTPYDPATDSYQRDPLVIQGRHGKASAIYNAHAYHTKVPPDAIKAYVEHYTDPGDVVLDPFCGSGMTGVAALLAGRNAIISDLSPAAAHIAYNYCTPVDLGALKTAWNAIREDVADEFAWLYGTRCDGCGGAATIQYTVWSDVLQCPHCDTELVLWDVAVVREQTRTGFEPPMSGLTEAYVPITAADAAPKKNGVARKGGDVLDSFACTGCRTELTKAKCAYVRGVPVLTSYECDGACRPKRRERAPNDAERGRIAEISASELPYPVPDTPFDERREMWRGGHRDQGITRVRDFWTHRNLWAIASLWSRASAHEDDRIARALRFVVTAAMLRTTKLYKYSPTRMSGIMNGTLYVPSLNVERNAIVGATMKARDILEAQAAVSGVTTKASAFEASAIRLQCLDATVDYVFTDPPFGSNIFYADCSLPWEVWLGTLTDQAQEAVWNKSRSQEDGGKSLDDYRDLMEQSFVEMYRVLKPGRWATVVFSNSDDRVWHAIQVAAQKAGFSVAGAGTLDKMQRSFKGMRGDKGEEKVVTKDVVMNLLKPVAGRFVVQVDVVADPEALIRQKLDAYLAELGTDPLTAREHRSTQALYDHIVTSLLRDGIPTAGFSLALIQSVAQEAFKQIDGFWYRRGERVRSDRLGMDIADDVSAISWLDARLGVQHMTEAEIIPDFNTASSGARISGGLSRLLQENFRMDPQTKRWRVPTLLERETLNDIGRIDRQKQVERAAGGAFHDLTATELLEIAEDAVNLELSDEARALIDRLHWPDLTHEEEQRARLVRMTAAYSAASDEEQE